VGCAEADRFDRLALVIADDEAKHRAIEAPDAADLLRAQMEQKGLKRPALLGSKARAWLNRRQLASSAP
jgi:antitoxin component HigA of HigAB toxin-antitoxin module